MDLGIYTFADITRERVSGEMISAQQHGSGTGGAESGWGVSEGTTCEVSKNLTGLERGTQPQSQTCEVFRNLTGRSSIFKILTPSLSVKTRDISVYPSVY